MLIARKGKIGYLQTVGALKPGGPDMPLDAIFRIYSMTKPVVSVAAMMLVEEGRLLLADPVSKFVPAFADAKVGIARGEELELVALKRPITVQDLMRHTSGLTYGFTGPSLVQRLLKQTTVMSLDKTTAEQADALAAHPLQHQPGEVWEYGHSTDVLGRVVEVVAGARLSEFLHERIFVPLAMHDTAFFTPPAKVDRRAEPFTFDGIIASGSPILDITAPPKFEMGGTGLISTIGDYARFSAMLEGGGELDGVRLLGRRTIDYMASDHLSQDIFKKHWVLAPGSGFGLGFSVRMETGVGLTLGSPGEFGWGGIAGTVFWVSRATRCSRSL